MTSDYGFKQTAGKKKKKQSTPFNWLEDEGDKKEPGDGNGEEKKDQNGGDSGNSGGDGAGDGNGDDGGNKEFDNKAPEEANADDIWNFTAVSSKKKNKAKVAETKVSDSFGLPDIPSVDFHEIKLDDTGGGGGEDEGGGVDPLGDLGFGSKAEKITTGLSAWTSSWTTGGWGWGGMKSPSATSPKPMEDTSKPTEPVVDDNPWSINRGKPKKKTTSTFNFGSFDQTDEAKNEPAIDFLGDSKPAEKKDLGGFAWGAPASKTADSNFWNNLGDSKAAEEKAKVEDTAAAAQEPVDDIWGWGSAKKDVSVEEFVYTMCTC